MTKKHTPPSTAHEKAASHPFKVGQQYRNRDGTYHVVSIDEPNMVIRYKNGYSIESPIILQARIWENLQEGNGNDLQLESS